MCRCTIILLCFSFVTLIFPFHQPELSIYSLNFTSHQFKDFPLISEGLCPYTVFGQNNTHENGGCIQCPLGYYQDACMCKSKHVVVQKFASTKYKGNNTQCPFTDECGIKTNHSCVNCSYSGIKEELQTGCDCETEMDPTSFIDFGNDPDNTVACADRFSPGQYLPLICNPCPAGSTRSRFSWSCDCTRTPEAFNYTGIPIKLTGEAILKITNPILLPVLLSKSNMALYAFGEKIGTVSLDSMKIPSIGSNLVRSRFDISSLGSASEGILSNWDRVIEITTEGLVKAAYAITSFNAHLALKCTLQIRASDPFSAHSLACSADLQSDDS